MLRKVKKSKCMESSTTSYVINTSISTKLSWSWVFDPGFWVYFGFMIFDFAHWRLFKFNFVRFCLEFNFYFYYFLLFFYSSFIVSVCIGISGLCVCLIPVSTVSVSCALCLSIHQSCLYLFPPCLMFVFPVGVCLCLSLSLPPCLYLVSQSWCLCFPVLLW